jgi:hypothetical protein
MAMTICSTAVNSLHTGGNDNLFNSRQLTARRWQNMACEGNRLTVLTFPSERATKWFGFPENVNNTRYMQRMSTLDGDWSTLDKWSSGQLSYYCGHTTTWAMGQQIPAKPRDFSLL